MNRYDIEEKEEWRKWIKEIPAINFPQEWQVQIIPPFSGAMVRFQVFKGEKHVSVYLDVHENLGFYDGQPYWEIYPFEGDVYRVHMNDTDELLKKIEQSLRYQ